MGLKVSGDVSAVGGQAAEVRDRAESDTDDAVAEETLRHICEGSDDPPIAPAEVVVSDADAPKAGVSSRLRLTGRGLGAQARG
jgi:hypothetical protein